MRQDSEPFIEGRIQKGVTAEQGKVSTVDPVMQLLSDEKEQAGITLTPDQRTAIFKILRELVYRDVRSIRELLRSIQGREKKGDE